MKRIGAKNTPAFRIVVADGRRDTVCGPPGALTAELARARERDRLQKAADESTTGPEHMMLADPDGNPILIDQHV